MPGVRRRLLVMLLRLRVAVAERLRPGEEHVTLFWAAVVGALGGLSSIIFGRILQAAQHFLTGSSGGFIEAATHLAPWQRVLVPALGAFIAGMVLSMGKRFMQGEKSVDYMEAIALGDAHIRSRSTFVRSAAAVFAIGSGASIGREGPMVQIASWISSWAGRRAKFALPRHRLIVACGAAAGIASAYNAPIAGALFVAEVVLGSIAVPTFGPLVLSSVVATIVVRSLDHGGPVYEVPTFRISTPWEAFLYLPLGVVCGFAAVFFMRFLGLVAQAFNRLPANLPLRLTLGGLIVGAISVLRPDVWGNGYGVVSSMLTTRWLPAAVAAALAAKILATSSSFGSGAPGGVFTPTLFVGAAIGTLFGIGAHSVFPWTLDNPQAYALVGMGCLLAGTTQAPLMAILMLFELTLDYDLILPLMLGCVAAHYTAQGLGASPIYRHHLRHKLATPWSVLAAADCSVRDIMRSDAPTLQETDGFEKVAEHFLTLHFDQAFVVDAEGHYKGCLTLHDVKTLLSDAVVTPLLTVHDLMHDRLPTVRENSTLAETLRHFGTMREELIAVTTADDRPRLVGAVSKSDLLIALAETKLDVGRPDP